MQPQVHHTLPPHVARAALNRDPYAIPHVRQRRREVDPLCSSQHTGSGPCGIFTAHMADRNTVFAYLAAVHCVTACYEHGVFTATQLRSTFSPANMQDSPLCCRPSAPSRALPHTGPTIPAAAGMVSAMTYHVSER